MKKHMQNTSISKNAHRSNKLAPIRSDTIDWNSVHSGNFWQTTDELQNNTLQKASKLFSVVGHADLHTLQAILIQYRYFTIYYISDLALLIAKLPDGGMRSFLADILSDELGCGDSNKAHPNLYDNFLVSIGVAETRLNNNSALKNNIELLDNARSLLVNNSGEFGIGLRGMGGECVCQVYIALLHKFLILNPYIVEKKNKIDWVFWDLHIGEHDIAHSMETRNLIHSEIVVKNDSSLHQLGHAYQESMRSWEEFWNNIFSAATNPMLESKFVKA